MISIIKAIFTGIVGGLVLGGIWELQDQDYYFGTILGLIVLALGLIIAADAVKKERR